MARKPKAKLTEYRYHGPTTAIDVQDGQTKGTVILVPGRCVALPDRDPGVARLVARRHLTRKETDNG